MFYIIYKITNQLDGKFYIGSHKTRDINDSYMGSGKYLKYAQEKYGIENFKKEILFVFDTIEDMYAKEAEIVNESFLAIENTYNLKIGGYGGWDYINADELSRIEKNRKARQAADSSIFQKYGVTNPAHLDIVKEKLSASMKRRIENGYTPKFPSFFGKTHTAETKTKISESAKITSAGEKNSQYGTRWIYSLEFKICKKISKELPLPEGWLEGRKLKF